MRQRLGVGESAKSTSRSPARSRYGAARAAEMAGDAAKARAYYLKLEALAAHADGGRPELDSMRAFLARKD